MGRLGRQSTEKLSARRGDVLGRCDDGAPGREEVLRSGKRQGGALQRLFWVVSKSVHDWWRRERKEENQLEPGN